MDTKTIDRVFAAFLLLFGAYITWNAVDYGYMVENRPGPGFFPFWVGLGLVGLSVANLWRSLRGIEVLESTFERKEMAQAGGVIAAIAAYILLVPVTGILLGIGLVVLATAFIIKPRLQPAFVARLVLIAAILPLVCYVIFGVYLQVPLVTGVFGF